MNHTERVPKDLELYGEPRYVLDLDVFHQLHCLNNILLAIAARVKEGKEPSSHVTHCLQYLRQMILCRADTTLEPVDPRLGPKAVQSAVTHTCRDWTRVYSLLEGASGRFL